MEVNELRTEIENLMVRMQSNEDAMVNFQRLYPAQQRTTYVDIATHITSGDEIQLESYRSIPEFSGDKKAYRSWRNQVVRRMELIRAFVAHPKYEAALAIIRAKITGAASDILTNNKTSYNINAFIERLDMAYTDQRPLYILEGEMAHITQANRSLQEFYDMINQSLNLVISKITLSYPTLNEQQPLIAEAQEKAIRTFIVGLRSQAIRNILYSHKPRTLPDAYTTAQTVYYDTQYLHLDSNRDYQRRDLQPRTQNSQGFVRPQQRVLPANYYPNVQPIRAFPIANNVNMNCNPPQHRVQQRGNQPEPMEVDPSNRIRQNFNWKQPNPPQKREYNSSRQQMQPHNKIQRINQLRDSNGDPNEGYEGDIHDDIPDVLISDTISHASPQSTTASAFLVE